MVCTSAFDAMLFVRFTYKSESINYFKLNNLDKKVYLL
jgi:hypothetical protein